jgi:hypothetical protein
LLTNTSKTFTAILLLFLCVAVSSKSTTALDSAGWQMIATPSVVVLYTLAWSLMIAVTWRVKQRRMEKDET